MNGHTSFEEMVNMAKKNQAKAKAEPAKQNDVVPVEKPLTKKERIEKLGLKLIQGGKA
jgi:hypothetical protein